MYILFYSSFIYSLFYSFLYVLSSFFMFFLFFLLISFISFCFTLNLPNKYDLQFHTQQVYYNSFVTSLKRKINQVILSCFLFHFFSFLFFSSFAISFVSFFTLNLPNKYGLQSHTQQVYYNSFVASLKRKINQVILSFQIVA